MYVRYKRRSSNKQTRHFYGYLFQNENAVSILKADFIVPGTKEYSSKISLKTLDDLPRYDPGTIDKSILPKLEFPLSRVTDKEKSNLNVYFGKGRWSRSTGKILARPWYEVELIANKKSPQIRYIQKVILPPILMMV